MSSDRLTIGLPLPTPPSVRGPCKTRSPNEDTIQRWKLADEVARGHHYRYEADRYRRIIMNERTLEMRKAELDAIFESVEEIMKDVGRPWDADVILKEIANRTAAIALDPLLGLRSRGDIDPEKMFHSMPNSETDVLRKPGDTFIGVEGNHQESVEIEKSRREAFIAWASGLPKDIRSEEAITNQQEEQEVEGGGNEQNEDKGGSSMLKEFEGGISRITRGFSFRPIHRETEKSFRGMNK